jgi:aspartate carbamoyltransferase catalytic subunit
MHKYDFHQEYAGWKEFADKPLGERLPLFRRDGRIYDVLFSQQFDRAFLDDLYDLTNRIRRIAKTREGTHWLHGLHSHQRAMLYFVQPSTRTFLSFQNACHILGFHTSEIRDPHTSSEIKGESPEDSIRTFSSYVDLIIMRHPLEGFAEKTAWLLNTSERPVPVINAGSGKDQHPTQALLDVYTLQRSFEHRGGIDGKVIAMVGDLKRGRTVRSLSYLMKNYTGVTILYAAPPAFQIGDDIKQFLKTHEIHFEERDSLEAVLDDADAIYMTRIQDEHDTDGQSPSQYEAFSLRKEHLGRMKPDAIIMHPLPRRGEIEVAIDKDPRAMYWRQERNGMWTRAALITKIFASDDIVREEGSARFLPRE